MISLKIPIESERELDGVPLTEKVSLIKPDVRLHNVSLQISWTVLDRTGN
ncbi:unnamed protein product, partial [Rotaria sp. Silwood2]